ncbi:GNAT family protein [Pseudomonas sp. RIT-PI-S]|uniref:GNAT family N-acetyltransferase n=1 Tax=Pseudomonas sp. RIT-PI-S TaxID=3035295 RepID=UPI0021D9A90E|nr:GNAT family protein [Pseudomonas sp. RIT-PI-S]
MARQNEYGQNIGLSVDGWAPRPQPTAVTLSGRYCRLEPLNVEAHTADLFAAYSQAKDGSDWTYLFIGPFSSADAYRAYVEVAAQSTDPRHFAVIDLRTGKAVGTLALMRIDLAHGVIEVGNVTFSPLLKQSALSTEAQYLLMAYAFDELGYRRYEWKCDDLNAPSRKAAIRLGFTYEGTFRRAVVYKGRSRDTAWYSIIREEWPGLKQAFNAWLAPENFDEQGQQRRSLASFRNQDQD